MIKYSIITINYNNFSGLMKTSNSIIPLLGNDIEWIVVDGESTDGSINLINHTPEITKYIIEKDHGIYDAMNKGIDIATGDFIIFMNSGDMFHYDFHFSKITKHLDGIDISSSLIYGNTLRSLSPIFYLDIINDKSKDWWKNTTPCHQSILLPRCFLKKNKFDMSYKIFADRKNMHSAFDTLENHINLNTTISIYELGGVSNIGGRNYKQMKIIINELLSIDNDNRNIKKIIKLYLKFIIIKTLGYRLYYSIMFFLKSIRVHNEK